MLTKGKLVSPFGCPKHQAQNWRIKVRYLSNMAPSCTSRTPARLRTSMWTLPHIELRPPREVADSCPLKSYGHKLHPRQSNSRALPSTGCKGEEEHRQMKKGEDDLALAVGKVSAHDHVLVPTVRTWQCCFTWQKGLFWYNAVKDLEMGRLAWIIQRGPRFYKKCSYKTAAGESESERCGIPEAEVTVTWSLVLKMEGVSRSSRSWASPGNRVSPSRNNAILLTPWF